MERQKEVRIVAALMMMLAIVLPVSPAEKIELPANSMPEMPSHALTLEPPIYHPNQVEILCPRYRYYSCYPVAKH